MRVIVAVLLCASFPARALAQGTVRLAYDADPACPSEEGFWASVVAREPAAARGEGRPFTVTAHEIDGGYRATLVVEGSTERAFDAPQCADAVAALALVTALAIHERIEAAEVGAVAEEPVAPPARRERVQRSVPEDRSGESRIERSWRVEIAGGLDVAPRRVGAPVLGAELAIGLRQDRGAAARLALVVAPAGLREQAGQRARFTWWLARIEGCPPGLASSVVRLVACAVVEAGVIAASGVGVPEARTALRPWLAPGLGGRLGVALGGAVELGLGAALVFATVRDRYVFADGSTVLRAPLLQPAGDLSVAVSIP